MKNIVISRLITFVLFMVFIASFLVAVSPSVATLPRIASTIVLGITTFLVSKADKLWEK